MAIKSPATATDALKSLKSLQEDAKRKSLDQLTMEQINAEIATFRREKALRNNTRKTN